VGVDVGFCVGVRVGVEVGTFIRGVDVGVFCVGIGVFVGREVAVGAGLHSFVEVLHPYAQVSVAPHCPLEQLCDFELLSIHRCSDPLHSSGTHNGESSHTVCSVHDTVRYVLGTFVSEQPPVPQAPVLSNTTLHTLGVAVAFGAALHFPLEHPYIQDALIHPVPLAEQVFTALPSHTFSPGVHTPTAQELPLHPPSHRVPRTQALFIQSYSNDCVPSFWHFFAPVVHSLGTQNFPPESGLQARPAQHKVESHRAYATAQLPAALLLVSVFCF